MLFSKMFFFNCSQTHRSSTELADALKHLEIFSEMFSAGRLLSSIRAKLGHPAVYVSEEIANVMVSWDNMCIAIFFTFLVCELPYIAKHCLVYEKYLTKKYW